MIAALLVSVLTTVAPTRTVWRGPEPAIRQALATYVARWSRTAPALRGHRLLFDARPQLQWYDDHMHVDHVVAPRSVDETASLARTLQLSVAGAEDQLGCRPRARGTTCDVPANDRALLRLGEPRLVEGGATVTFSIAMVTGDGARVRRAPSSQLFVAWLERSGDGWVVSRVHMADGGVLGERVR